MEKKFDGGIGIDLDDTIAGSSKQALKRINELYGLHAKMKDWKQFKISACFPVTEQQAAKVFSEIWSEPEKIKLVDKNIPNIIARLSSRHRVYLLTATLGARNFYESWLEDHGISFDGMIKVQKSVEKIVVGNSHGLDYYIDDHELVAKSVAEAGKKAILIEKPWNAKFAESVNDENIKVVHSWHEIDMFFSNLDKDI